MMIIGFMLIIVFLSSTEVKLTQKLVKKEVEKIQFQLVIFTIDGSYKGSMKRRKRKTLFGLN